MTIESRPTSILIADKPLRLGGQVERISVSDLEKKLGITYKEKIDIGECPNIQEVMLPERICGPSSPAELKRQLETLLIQPRDDLVLCRTDPVGYGVFASRDIIKDTVVAFYSGTLIPGRAAKSETDYAMGYLPFEVSFSTKDHRGLSSFFQHFPATKNFPDIKQLWYRIQERGNNISEDDLKLEAEIYSIELLDNRIQHYPATENIYQAHVIFNGVPVILLVTNRQIQAGEQLGFKYGRHYWFARGIAPEIFDLWGAVMSTELYRRNFYQLKFDQFTYTGDLKHLVLQVRKGVTQIILRDDNAKVQKIDSSVLAEELIRVRAMTETENPNFKIYSQKTHDPFFNTAKLEPVNKNDQNIGNNKNYGPL